MPTSGSPTRYRMFRERGIIAQFESIENRQPPREE
jgi:hypothetical protein